MMEKNQWVISESMAAKENGLPVLIDGKDYTGGFSRLKNLVKEDADYMSDFIFDEQGKIISLEFNKIRKLK